MLTFPDWVKRTAFLFLSLFPALIFAREITPDEAATAAQNWLRRGPRPLGASIAPLSAAHSEVLAAADENGRKLFYLVPVDGGTVVTSTDDELPPVLAFTECEDVPASDDNPLWAILMSGARSRMDSLVAAGNQAKHSVQPLSASTGDNSAPAEWASLLAPPSDSLIWDLGIGVY